MFSSGVEVLSAASLSGDFSGGGAEDLFGSGVDAAGELFGGAADTPGDLLGSPGDAVFSAAADAVSAASEAAESTFQGVWDLSKPILDSNGAAAAWFRTTFMDGIAAHIPFQMFQLMVVLTEIFIGLALMGGLFTWWAAAVSIVLCLVFTLSGMFAWNQVWFLFAGILMLGGAGRAFGLDCWAVPFFKKWWNGTRFARRHYWYLDGPSK